MCFDCSISQSHALDISFVISVCYRRRLHLTVVIYHANCVHFLVFFVCNVVFIYFDVGLFKY